MDVLVGLSRCPPWFLREKQKTLGYNNLYLHHPRGCVWTLRGRHPFGTPFMVLVYNPRHPGPPAEVRYDWTPKNHHRSKKPEFHLSFGSWFLDVDRSGNLSPLKNWRLDWTPSKSEKTNLEGRAFSTPGRGDSFFRTPLHFQGLQPLGVFFWGGM